MPADVALRDFARAMEAPEAGMDLARAALLIARLEYPDLDVDHYLDRLAATARAAAAKARGLDDLGRLHRLREYLFEELRFAGNAENYYDPRNSFLNDVLDRRLGIPITLSLVLMEVGRRLGLTMEGVGLPGHFVTGVRVGGEQILLDPFNGGTVLTPAACRELAARALGRPVELAPEHLAPVTKRQLLTRMLRNLKTVYWQQCAWPRVIAVIDRILVLDPAAGGEWRDRGLALQHMGEVARGLRDWERYLTDFPNAPDHERVRGQLRRLRLERARFN
jgi:regulator of sirC expression with transglutaminase-like and TPR domain